MSGNPLHQFNSSDSDVFSSFDQLLPRTLRTDSAAELPTLHGGVSGPMSVRSAPDDAFGNAQVDAHLREIPLPSDFLDRMRRAADEF